MPNRCLYFDGNAGAAGNMILGALLDLGADLDAIVDCLRAIVPVDFTIETQRVEKHGVGALLATVTAKEDKSHRHLSDVLALLNQGGLTDAVRAGSSAVFRRLAQAEGKIHGKSEEKVHFHEVGAADAIIDVVGSFVALEQLNVDRVYSAPLVLGAGSGRSTHGPIQFPAPATVEILRDKPVKFDGPIGETTTPTGAAILTEIAEFTEFMPMTIESVGYGAGSKDFPDRPNVLRAVLGSVPVNFERDEVLMGVSTIDNTRPEVFDWLMERLMGAGAFDVVVTQVMMKKNRPGIELQVVCDQSQRKALSDIILTETNSLGVRWSLWERDKLPRSVVSVKTRWGEVRVKVARINDEQRGIPEYDDCRRVAAEHHVPLQRVIEEASQSFRFRLE